MERQQRRRAAARGMTLIELMIAMIVGAVLMTVIIQTLIVGSRVSDQQSAQVDVHWYARQAVKKFSEDARDAFAVLRYFSVPSTTGWSDAYHLYLTTWGYDWSGSAEDDRFTVVFLLPSVSPDGSVVLSPSSSKIASFDAIVWTLTPSTETASAAHVHEKLYEMKRSVYPAAALSDTSYSYTGGSTVRVGADVPLERTYGNDIMAYSVVQASQDESTDSTIGRLSRPAVSLRNADGTETAFSPKALLTGGDDLQNAQSPASTLATLTADQRQALPLIRTGTTAPAGNYPDVTDASLVDLRLAIWEQGRGTHGQATGDAGKISMYTSTNNRLRNKRDWN
ncbi:MAG: type II secretion system protein [Armatimonadetes bacterium]|nr:type II secretion system protein [Armatimonadota bacterium]